MTSRKLGKVYVTGADGFIGSHLVERLVHQGFEVTALCVYNSNGSHGWLDGLAEEKPANLHLILGDVRDPFFMESSVAGHDTVFHLASLIAIPYSYQAPQSYVETNVVGTLNVAQACLKHGVGRLVHTSTSEVYGTAQFVPISESHPLQGQSPYSASKIGADMMIDAYCRSFALPAVTLRPFNTYGPRQSLRAVIPTVCAQIVSGVKTIKLGSVTPTRDFNYVSDTAAAFHAVGACADDSIIGRVFNAGSGREISVGDLVSLVARLCGKSVEVESESDRIRPQSSEVERLLADASLLRETTGWAPQVSLEDGLRHVIEWINRPNVLKRAGVYHR